MKIQIRLDERRVAEAKMLAMMWGVDPNDRSVIQQIVEKCISERFHAERIATDARFTVTRRIEDGDEVEQIHLESGGEIRF